METAAIAVRHLSFTYDNRAEKTLDDLSFTLPKASKTLLVGPSGSGKSTLLSLLNGLIGPQQGDLTGTLLINGQDARGQGVLERSLAIGTILQDSDRQFVGQTVAEDIAFVLENEAKAQDELRQAVAEIAALLGLTDLLSSGPTLLSGGQKQRVAMAGVLVGQSPILILDEPLASLDPQTGQELLAVLDRLQAEQGLTILMVEHRLDEVLRTDFDQVLVLQRGQLAFAGTSSAFLQQSDFEEWGLQRPPYVDWLCQSGLALSELVRLDRVDQLVLPARSRLQPLAPLGRPAGAPSPVILAAKDLSFTYGTQPILSHVSLTVHRDEWLALLGRNGSGKSTLARLLAGFLKKQSGQIIFDPEGAAIDSGRLSLGQWARYVGYVSQNPNEMLIGQSVYDEVASGLVRQGLAADQIQERVLAGLRQADLYRYRNWPAIALSYGQKKRLSVLVLAVLQPAVLILDEPTAAQDGPNAQALLQYLATLQASGVTIITVTHDLNLLRHWANRLLLLKDGQLEAGHSAAELFRDPVALAAASLILPSDLLLQQRIEKEQR
ncbi:ABC transporter ATP-binding protein [Leuconostocaceae bacterium ESL0958]|nr:ABC transporter ATP-binding protein [Leuconostocaceae bacterium ESL0958]